MEQEKLKKFRNINFLNTKGPCQHPTFYSQNQGRISRNYTADITNGGFQQSRRLCKTLSNVSTSDESEPLVTLEDENEDNYFGIFLQSYKFKI